MFLSGKMFISRKYHTIVGYFSPLFLSFFSFSHLVVLQIKFHPGAKKLCKMIFFNKRYPSKLTISSSSSSFFLLIVLRYIRYITHTAIFEREQAFLFLFYLNMNVLTEVPHDALYLELCSHDFSPHSNLSPYPQFPSYDHSRRASSPILPLRRCNYMN